MNKISNIEEIIKQIATIRNLRKGYITNFFLDEKKHSLWILKGILYSERIGDSFFLIKENNGFNNVFYASTTIDDLISDFNKLNITQYNKTIIIDFIGKKEVCKQISQVFISSGFNIYCKLKRMSKPTTFYEYIPSNDVIYATKEDVKDVLDILNQYFDVLTEQIPFIEELEKLAQKNHILLYKIEGMIAGFVIFEMSHVSLYLRYWFVHPNFREKGIGSKLLKRYFYEGKNTMREQLWVICDNENAIKRYRHFDYKDENMYDYVITNKKIQYERENR